MIFIHLVHWKKICMGGQIFCLLHEKVQAERVKTQNKQGLGYYLSAKDPSLG